MENQQNHPHQMVGSPPRKSPIPAPMPQQAQPVLMGNMLPGMMPMVPPMLPMMGLPGGVGLPPHPSLSPHHIQQMVNQPLYPQQVAANMQQQYGMPAPVPTVQPQALPAGAPGFPRSNSNSAPAMPPRPSSQNATASPPAEPSHHQPQPQHHHHAVVASSPPPDRPEHRKRKPTTDDYEEEQEPAPRTEEQFRNVRQRPAMMPRETVERIHRHSEQQPIAQPQAHPQPAADAAAMDTDAPHSGKAEAKDMDDEEEESAATEDIGMIAIYAPGGTLPRLERFEGQLIEVRVPAKFLTNKNREVQTMQLWGTDIYTDDSDAAAILAHVGVLTLRPVPPPNCAGYSAFFRVLPGQEGYVATNRFSYRSRPWASLYQRCSLQFVRADKQEDPALFRTDVESGAPAGKADSKANGRRHDSIAGVRTRRGGQRVHVMNYVEKAALKQGARGRRRFIPDVVILFNSLNEPCLKYSLGLVMDRSVDKSEWTSTRLRHECMYFEADQVIYELAREQPDAKAGAEPSNKFDRYRWSIVKKAALPLPTTKGTLKKDPSQVDQPIPVPLPADKVEVLSSGIDWQDIEWAPTHVSIGGSVFTVETVQFKART